MPDERFIVLHRYQQISFHYIAFYAMRKDKCARSNTGEGFHSRFVLVGCDLTLDRAFNHAFDDVLLRGEIEDDDGENADDNQRHNRT